MDSKEVVDIADAALKTADASYSVFDGIAKATPVEFDPVLHYSINASLCEYMAAIHRMALSCALIAREHERREKRIILDEEAKKALADLAEPQRDIAQDVPVVKGKP